MQLNLQSGLGSRGTGTSGADTGTGIGDPDTDTAVHATTAAITTEARILDIFWGFGCRWL